MLNLKMHSEEATISKLSRMSYITWMKAVPMMTPVPKCLTEKNTHVGIRSLLTRFAIMGKRAPDVNQSFYQCREDRMLKLRGGPIKQRYVSPAQTLLQCQQYHLHCIRCHDRLLAEEGS